MPQGIRTLSDILDSLDSIINELEARRPSPDSHGHSDDYMRAVVRSRECRFWLTAAIASQPLTRYDATDHQEIPA